MARMKLNRATLYLFLSDFQGKIVPFTTLLIALCFDFAQIPGVSFISPQLVYGVLFFWILYRPDLLPFGSLFVISICADVLKGALLGLTAVEWFVFYLVILPQRKLLIKASFFMVWSAFSLLVGLLLFCKWLFFSMLSGHILSGIPVLFQALLTLLLYPFMSCILIFIQKLFIERFTQNDF
ncbi:MAG: hypothetical protein HOI80_00045 [Alphaproteobacteria bacterium]|nr:hypothetical protein [Alphaproteobacteria bacterium]